MLHSESYLEKLNVNQILDLSKFVVTENQKHHSGIKYSQNSDKDVQSIYKEEISFYENSQIFVVRDHQDDIQGSIRLLKWNYIDVLPIEKMFGINPLLIKGAIKADNIYHIGRFAVKKNIKDINLFKKLIVSAIEPICSNKNNIAFAECDSKLLRILSLLGIKANIIGKSIHYLGSETIPISLSYEGLISFYNANKSLVNNTNFKKEKETILMVKHTPTNINNRLVN